MTRHAAASSRNTPPNRDGAGTMGLERDSETARLSQAGRPLAPPTDNADGGTAVEPIHRQSPETPGVDPTERIAAALHEAMCGDHAYSTEELAARDMASHRAEAALVLRVATNDEARELARRILDDAEANGG